MLTRDGYCTREIKMRIAMSKEEFNRKISALIGQLNIVLRKKFACVMFGALDQGTKKI